MATTIRTEWGTYRTSSRRVYIMLSPHDAWGSHPAGVGYTGYTDSLDIAGRRAAKDARDRKRPVGIYRIHDGQLVQMFTANGVAIFNKEA